jgi:hypothetical protein
MALVNHTILRPGDARSVTNPNTLLDAVETQSTNITGPNFREEGLDRDSFVAGPAFLRFNTREDVITNFATGGVWTTLTLGATLFTTAGFTLAAGELLRIRGAVSFANTVAAGVLTNGGIPAGGVGQMRLVYDIGAGNVEFTGSIRSMQSENNRGAAALPDHGSLRSTNFWDVVTPVTSVSLQVRNPNGANLLQINYAALTGVVFRRV